MNRDPVPQVITIYNLIKFQSHFGAKSFDWTNGSCFLYGEESFKSYYLAIIFTIYSARPPTK